MPLLPRRSTARRRYEAAWRAWDAGDQVTGLAELHAAVDAEPSSSWWFDLGLMHKWRREWAECLAANLEAARLDPSNAPAAWNGGIAATALSDWSTARRLWAAYGVRLSEGEGEPVDPIGTTPVRVGDDGAQEVVWCTRLDPARARVENVPTPACGRRWGDVVLHDGVPNGERHDGRQWLAVFDEIEVWRRSTTPHLSVRLGAAGPGAAEALVDAVRGAGWGAEDWTGSVQVLCRACSEGRPDPTHDHPPMDDWAADRRVGLACPPELAVRLLDGWAAAPDRSWSELEPLD